MFQKLSWLMILKFLLIDFCCSHIQRIGGLKGRIGIDCICAVEVVDNAAFGIEHTMQVSK